MPKAETDMQTLSQWLELSAPEPEPCIDNIIKLIYSPGHFNHITVPAAFKCNCIWGQGTPLILCFGNSSVSGPRKPQGKRRRPRAPWTTSGACSNGWVSPLWGSQVAIENPWYLRNCVFTGKSSWIFIALFDYQRALSSDFYFIIFPSFARSPAPWFFLGHDSFGQRTVWLPRGSLF